MARTKITGIRVDTRRITGPDEIYEGLPWVQEKPPGWPDHVHLPHPGAIAEDLPGLVEDLAPEDQQWLAWIDRPATTADEQKQREL